LLAVFAGLDRDRLRWNWRKHRILRFDCNTDAIANRHPIANTCSEPFTHAHHNSSR
jgi:hypothetical protein